MAKTKTPKWTKEEIKALLVKSDAAVIRGLIRIHGFQTAEEQSSGQTVEDNGLGFNALDAEFMTEMVIFHKHHGYLTVKQLAIVRKKLLKYAGQLVKIAKSG